MTTTYPDWPIDTADASAALRRAEEARGRAETVHEIVRAQAAAALLRRGRSVREVARLLGVSKSTVSRVATANLKWGWAADDERAAAETDITQIWENAAILAEPVNPHWAKVWDGLGPSPK